MRRRTGKADAVKKTRAIQPVTHGALASTAERKKLCMIREKRGPLKNIEPIDDPLQGRTFSDDAIDGINDKIDALATVIARQKAKAAKANKNAKREHRRAKQWSDAKFYTVLVFPTGKICQAFLDAVKIKAHITDAGDLFIDGRMLADVWGITLPEPEYSLKMKNTEVKTTMTKKLKKVPSK